MNRILGLKVIANIALWVMVIGGIVFTLGFGSCLYIARQEINAEADKKVQRDIDYVNAFIDGQLQRVEDAAYSLASRNFGKTLRKEDGSASVDIDPATFKRPMPEECYVAMEQFMDANPIICGIAFAFEPYVYPDVESKYGFSPYVNRLSGKYRRYDLGEYMCCWEKEWYRETAKANKGYWSNPFRESSLGHVVSSFSIPVHGYGGRLVGVLSLDIDTEAFSKKCSEVLPYPNSIVTLVDRNFNFICHPDTSFLLKNVSEAKRYIGLKTDDSMEIKMKEGEEGNYRVTLENGQKELFYFSPIKRANWTIAIECPEKDIYGNVDRMKRDTTIIAIVSILFMIFSFVWMFRRLQKVSLSKAGIVKELKIASSIQMGMIPKTYPAFPDRKELDVCGFIKPAKSVGGDLYDYFIRDEKFFFCIGDVSGKGIPASLFMAVIKALFHNISMHTDNPANIASALNDAISEGNEMNMFCTMFIGVLDLKTGQLEYCNAGHNAPIIRQIKDGKLEVRYANPHTNIAIGILGGFTFESEQVALYPGEAIFLYTDGVTEAENKSHELFGEERTLQALRSARTNNARTSKDFVEQVYQSIAAYASDAEQSDDITMLVVEYRGKE